ncbi:MAG: porin family protein [Hyphomicrobiales bacterium]
MKRLLYLLLFCFFSLYSIKFSVAQIQIGSSTTTTTTTTTVTTIDKEKPITENPKKIRFFANIGAHLTQFKSEALSGFGEADPEFNFNGGLGIKIPVSKNIAFSIGGNLTQHTSKRTVIPNSSPTTRAVNSNGTTPPSQTTITSKEEKLKLGYYEFPIGVNITFSRKAKMNLYGIAGFNIGFLREAEFSSVVSATSNAKGAQNVSDEVEKYKRNLYAGIGAIIKLKSKYDMLVEFNYNYGASKLINTSNSINIKEDLKESHFGINIGLLF